MFCIFVGVASARNSTYVFLKKNMEISINKVYDPLIFVQNKNDVIIIFAVIKNVVIKNVHCITKNRFRKVIYLIIYDHRKL